MDQARAAEVADNCLSGNSPYGSCQADGGSNGLDPDRAGARSNDPTTVGPGQLAASPLGLETGQTGSASAGAQMEKSGVFTGLPGISGLGSPQFTSLPAGYLSPHLSRNFLTHLAQPLQKLHGRPVTPVKIWTGESLGTFPVGTVSDAQKMLQRARQAQSNWGTTCLSERRRFAQKLLDQVCRHQTQLIELAQLCNGKSQMDAYYEYCEATGTLKNLVHNLEPAIGARRARPLLPVFSRVRLEYAPIGVIAAFTLNDMPISYGCAEIMTALLAGNSVIQFVPYQSALGAAAVRSLAFSCGLPKDAWQIIPGQTLGVGLKMVSEFDQVIFIGSTANGAEIKVRTQDKFINSALFLGTNNQGIVLADADLKMAIPKVARAAFHQTGQGPCHIERVWVPRSIYPKFLNQLSEYVRRHVRLGGAWDNRYTIGSLYSAGRLDMVKRHVEDALELGAKLVVGGKARPDLGPYFFEPTVLTQVPPAALCYDEETYGPVLAVEPYDDLHSVLDQANASQYAYHLVVFTSHPSGIRDLLKHSAAGMISINDPCYLAWGSAGVPIQGALETGNGLRHSIHSIRQYARQSTIVELDHRMNLSPGKILDGKSYDLAARVLMGLYRPAYPHRPKRDRLRRFFGR